MEILWMMNVRFALIDWFFHEYEQTCKLYIYCTAPKSSIKDAANKYAIQFSTTIIIGTAKKYKHVNTSIRSHTNPTNRFFKQRRTKIFCNKYICFYVYIIKQNGFIHIKHAYIIFCEQNYY